MCHSTCSGKRHQRTTPGGLHQLIRLGGSLHASLRMGLRMLMRVLMRLVCQLLRLRLRLRMCNCLRLRHTTTCLREAAHLKHVLITLCLVISAKKVWQGTRLQVLGLGGLLEALRLCFKGVRLHLRLHLEGPRRRVLALEMQAACMLLHSSRGLLGTHDTALLCDYPTQGYVV